MDSGRHLRRVLAVRDDGRLLRARTVPLFYTTSASSQRKLRLAPTPFDYSPWLLLQVSEERRRIEHDHHAVDSRRASSRRSAMTPSEPRASSRSPMPA